MRSTPKRAESSPPCFSRFVCHPKTKQLAAATGAGNGRIHDGAAVYDGDGYAEGVGGAPRVLASPSQLPLLRTQRACAELVVKHVLTPSPAHPAMRSLGERLGVAKLATEAIHRQQHELSAALGLADRVPRLYLHEYDAMRTWRLALWEGLLRAPDPIGVELDACGAVDKLILSGALPYMHAFTLPHLKLPPSFVPHHNGMALRHEGVLMLHALLGQRARRPALFDQLLHALQRDKLLVREVARLSPVLASGRARSERDETLCASAVALFVLLDSAADLRLWQLMAEADCARATHQIFTLHPDAPPVPLARLLAGEHTLQRPLGRLAATLVHAMRAYEREHHTSHPLMTGAMRGGS